MAAEARYGTALPDDINQLKQNSRAANTVKQTDKWIKTYQDWATLRGKQIDIKLLQPIELDSTLQQFYAEIRKKNGEEYEPTSLNSMITSLDRYLRENQYPFSLQNSREFASSKSVLEGKARHLREMGKGNRPNRAHSITTEEEKVLWDCGQLGTKNPLALVNSV